MRREERVTVQSPGKKQHNPTECHTGGRSSRDPVRAALCRGPRKPCALHCVPLFPDRRVASRHVRPRRVCGAAAPPPPRATSCAAHGSQGTVARPLGARRWTSPRTSPLRPPWGTAPTTGSPLWRRSEVALPPCHPLLHSGLLPTPPHAWRCACGAKQPPPHCAGTGLSRPRRGR